MLDNIRMSESIHDPSHPDIKDGYERQDVNGMTGVWLSVLFVIFMVLTFVFINEYFTFAVESDKHKIQMEPQSVLLRDVRARDQEILTTYAVIDSTKNTYRIPVDKAMQMMADSAFSKQVESSK